jgi:hypothetical protein
MPRRRRFVRERELAIAALVELRPFAGRRLEVELRGEEDPELAVLWEAEVPLAARLGVTVVSHHRSGPTLREALGDAARRAGLQVDLLSERDLWRVVAP